MPDHNLKVGDEVTFKSTNNQDPRWHTYTVTEEFIEGAVRCGPFILDGNLRVLLWPPRSEKVSREYVCELIRKKDMMDALFDWPWGYMSEDQIRRVWAIVNEKTEGTNV